MIYIFFENNGIRPEFKGGRRMGEMKNMQMKSTLSERGFDVSKGSNLNPKEATPSCLPEEGFDSDTARHKSHFLLADS